MPEVSTDRARNADQLMKHESYCTSIILQVNPYPMCSRTSLIVENNGNAPERFDHLHMYHENPVCAQEWYVIELVEAK